MHAKKPAPDRLGPPDRAEVGHADADAEMFVKSRKARIEPTCSTVRGRSAQSKHGGRNPAAVADKSPDSGRFPRAGYNPRHLTTPDGRETRSAAGALPLPIL
jgi:hypothetical protein